MFTITSCDKKRDRFFEESPTNRLNTSISGAYQALQSSDNGWIIKYFPSKTVEFGGYTLFAKFTTNTNVELFGDYTPLFLPDRKISKSPNSNYQVYPGAGPILTFDEYNSVIHYFTLPAYEFEGGGIGAVDQGYKGDFEFLVVKATKDSIILEGRKTLNKIVMVPIPPSEAATIQQSYKDAVAKFHSFGSFVFEIGEDKISAPFFSPITKRSIRPEGTTENYAYRYTPKGLEFYKEYELKGIRFSELKYVEPTGAYNKGYFTNEAETIKLVPQS